DLAPSPAVVCFGPRLYRRPRRMPPLGGRLWPAPLRNPRLLRVVQKGIDGPRTTIVGYLARAQQTAQFPSDLAPDAVARVLIALFQGFILQQAWNDRTEIGPFAAAARPALDAVIDQPD